MRTRRLRVLRTEADQFPDWWPKSAVDNSFALVSARPDVCLLPLPSWTWSEHDFRLARRMREDAPSRLLTAVYYPFDSWDDPARSWQGPKEWREPLQRYVLGADVVAGPTLPVDGGPRDVVPLPYPSLVRRVPVVPDLTESTLDLAFAGYFREPGWAAPPVDSRDRRYRGHLLRRLQHALPPDRILVRNAEFWRTETPTLLRRRYVRELDRTALVLAPAGYGYLTFRHADGWARGRAVLSENLQRRVQVPQPERWESQEICLTYDPAGDDIGDVVIRALDDRARLQAVAAAGWEYGRRWTDPAAQATAWADALRARLG